MFMFWSWTNRNVNLPKFDKTIVTNSYYSNDYYSALYYNIMGTISSQTNDKQI